MGAAPRVRPHEVELLETALRALLINVPRSAGVHEALLHVDIVTEQGAEPGEPVEVVELVVTDEGAGFPPEALAAGVAAMRSLAVHQRLLAEHGGALRVLSVPGLTQVTLTLPIAPAPAAAERPPGAREGRVRGVRRRGARAQSARSTSGRAQSGRARSGQEEASA
ncbi:hypothetical protein [Streptomyces himastatinicus]|uniref:hypothetical protein n=1 Tax=Streptomyces himastatinicus TaxID=998084 RepID=UPI0001B4F380|nr:hypothetical protein [Streptomyces himastatinicus]